MQPAMYDIVREAIRNDAFRTEMLANPEQVGERYSLTADELRQLQQLDGDKLQRLSEWISTDGANKL